MNGADGPRFAGGRRTLLMLAAISALGSMAIHMIVPALPQIAGELAVDAQTAQHVVSFYLFGLGCGQLLAGPFADRLGRRPVLLAGLSLYTVSALLGAFAPTTETLLVARICQALGASAGLVTSRAMVGDLFDPAETGRRQATLMSVVLVSPAIAPALGGFIAGAAGWRAIFLLLGAIGLLALVITAHHLPESLQRPESGTRRDLVADYRRLLRNTAFLRTSAAIAGASSALYMFLSAAPFLLITQWHLSPQQAGVCFLAVAAASIAGTRFVGWLETRGNAFRHGLAVIAIGSALMLAAAVAGWTGPPALIGPMMVLGVGAGISAPSGIASVIRAEDGLAGTAASLAGALQMLGSSLAASALGLVGDPSFLVLGIGVTAISAMTLLVAPALKAEPLSRNR